MSTTCVCFQFDAPDPASRPYQSISTSGKILIVNAPLGGALKYEIDISSPDEARTSLCHCKNCKVGSANKLFDLDCIPSSKYTPFLPLLFRRAV